MATSASEAITNSPATPAILTLLSPLTPPWKLRPAPSGVTWKTTSRSSPRSTPHSSPTADAHSSVPPAGQLLQSLSVALVGRSASRNARTAAAIVRDPGYGSLHPLYGRHRGVSTEVPSHPATDVSSP